MIALWLVLAAMTAAAVALLLHPLLRRRPAAGAAAPAAHDLAVYRDQLAEVERDVARGLLDAAQAEAARAEVARRMLGAADAPRRPAAPEAAAGRAARWAAAALLVLVPLGALGLYLQLGAPGVPSMPWSPDSPAVLAARQRAEVSDLADKLAARLATDPEHPDGWVLLGRTYGGLERYADSAAAFAQAIARGATGAEVQSDYGEALVFAEGGQVGTKAVAAFEAALKADPADPRARYYLGLARAQAGEIDLALAQWLALEKDLPADHPERPALASQIDAAARALGLDPATLPGRAGAAPAPSR